MLNEKMTVILVLTVCALGTVVLPRREQGSESESPPSELAEVEEKFIELRQGDGITQRIYPAQKMRDDTIHHEWGSLSWVASRNIGNAEGLTLGHVIIEPGKTNPRHCHFKCEEVLYVLKGTIRQTWGDNEVVLNAGDTFWVGRAVFHNAENIGKEAAELVVSYDSADRDFVKEVDYNKDPSKYPPIRKPNP